MTRLFSRRADHRFKAVGITLAVVGLLVVSGVTYYATPAYTRVGYKPTQPIAFSHKLHAGDLAMSCTHCHTNVESSPHANVPDTQTCLSCHGASWGNIKSGAASLEPLREAERTGSPLDWVRVHKVPDYAYFNHAVHVARGVSCVDCHGQVNEMEIVSHKEPLSMAWCLDCHRNPWEKLRPADKVLDLDWSPENDPHFDAKAQAELTRFLKEDVGIKPPQDCSACHR